MESEGNPPARSRVASLAVLVVVFLTGAALMALEIVGSRILAPHFGSSIFVWGSLIGAFLGSLAIGYEAGGRLADRHPSGAMLGFILLVASALVTATVPIAEPTQRWIVALAIGPRLGPLFAALLLFAPAGALMGTIAPLAVRLRARSLAGVGSTVGSLYATSTVGSIVGTIGAAFWLVPMSGSRAVVLSIGAVTVLAALVSGVTVRDHRRKIVAAGVAILLTQAVMLERAPRQAWSPRFHVREGGVAFAGNDHVRESFDSQYHRITIIDAPAEHARWLMFDRFSQGGARLEGDTVAIGRPVLTYQAAVDLFLRYQEHARSVLVVGLGAGYAPVRARMLWPEARVEVVEIDPGVVDVARRWFALDRSSAEVHVADARAWLAASDAKFDLVFLDAFHAESIPFHLATREFLRIVEQHLAPGGVLVANIIGAVDGRSSSLFRSMYRTFAEVFPHRAVHPLDGRPFAMQNVFLFAWTASRTIAAPLEVAPLDGRDGIAFSSRPYEGAIPTEDVPTLTDDYAPMDALLSVTAE
jgi:spermidine synthase